jgi:hypothetical protein
MDRVLQATPATITETWSQSDGTIIDPGVVAVTVFADDGTTLASGTASGTGAAARGFSLDVGDTALLDRLRVVWTSSAGTLTSIVEVVGGFLITTGQLRALLPDETAHPDDRLREARIYAETELERALGFALVPRYTKQAMTVRRSSRLRLRPYVRTVRSATVGGTPLGASDLSALVFEPGGYVNNYYWWTGAVVVAYEHGLDADNPLSSGANRAALSLAMDYLGADTGGVDPRAERLITDDGTLVYGAGATGPFGMPSVNQWVRANGIPLTA